MYSRDPSFWARHHSICSILLGSLSMLVACGNDTKPTSQSASVPVEIRCKDGLDNDKDGKVDCEDVDCQSPGGDCVPAPALDRTVASTVANTAAFLYTGDNPLQKDADPTAFDAKRVAMLHGKVSGVGGEAQAGVRVSVQGHNEYGYTFTRADGAYDLAVNGGSRLLLDFSLDGHLPAQRATLPGWQSHEAIGDLGLVEAAGRTASLTANSQDSQTITGNTVADVFGEHEPFLVFEPGTIAKAVLPDGSREALTNLTVTITEFPVDSKNQFLPGSPPATTGVSYALNFEVDEATKLGASHVEFSVPVSMYVENFLGLAVGTAIPMAIYDRSTGQWEAGDSGRVLEIIDVIGGVATIDSDGDGAADAVSTLAALGISASDLKRLGERYDAGSQIWYGKVAHFSSAKAQPPMNAPKGAAVPNGYGLRKGTVDHPSRIGPVLVEPLAVSSAIPITGTPYSLEYQSLRARGYGPAYQLDIPLTGAELPPGLKRVVYRVDVAGRRYEGTALAAANQTQSVVWDGKDSQGRLLQSPQKADVTIGYVYDAAMPSDQPPSAPNEVTLSETFHVRVGLWDAKSFEIGGFGIDVLHAYDPVLHTIYFGYGDQRSGDSIALVTKPTNLDKSFSVGTPDSVFVTSDGSIIFTDDQQNDDTAPGRIIRLTSDGKPSILAGPGAAGIAADDFLAQPQGIVVLDDGSMIVADILENAIRRIDPSGNMITLVSGDTADNPQVLHDLTHADGMAIGPRQELYIVDIDRVLVFEAGKLATFAGGGNESGDGGLAVNASLAKLSAVAVSRDGIVYVSERDGNRIRKVLADGSIVTIAGDGTAGFSGDGAAASSAQLSGPRGISVGPDGSVYFADQGNDRIRRITPDGLIFTVIGGGKYDPAEGGLAVNVALDAPDGIAMGPDGSLYVTTMDNIFRVSPGLPDVGEKENLIPSEDGLLLYRFDHHGKHLATLDAMTGITELTFGYDAAGLPASITDKNGRVTRINRDALGTPTSIVGPYGQVTTIELSMDGNLAKVTDPIARTIELNWDVSTGFLARVTDPTASETSYDYDALGRLTDVRDSAASKERSKLPTHHFEPTVTSDGFMSVTVSTREGKATEYLSRFTMPDVWQRAVKAADGTRREWTETPAVPVVTRADGTTTTTYMVPDMQFGTQSMVPAFVIVELPSGKSMNSIVMRWKGVSDWNNVLSLDTWRDEAETNGRKYETTYSRGGRTQTTTTPMGRQSTTNLDELGRPIAISAAGMPSIALSYDHDGRVATITKTAGAETRTEVRGYGTDGWLSTRTNPLSEQISYAWDLVGRPTTITRPDNSAIAWAFDNADNVKALTPPGGATHSFAYDDVTKLLTLATPPAVTDPISILPAGQQSYSYGDDHELIAITRSDGSSIGFSYDSAGRLTNQTLGKATLTFGYDTTGAMTTISRSDSVKLEMTHDGPLWTSTTWSGVISGSLKADYDSNWWLKSLTVNDASTVSFSYDNDGLLIGASSTAGAMTVARDANTGMVTGTTLSNMTTAQSFNGFAELSNLSASLFGNMLFNQTLERDALGRVTHIVESNQGATRDLKYSYDNLGRLQTATRDAVTTTYGYDLNGNRTSAKVGTDAEITATYDAQDRIQTYGVRSCSHTAHGDLLTCSDGENSLLLDYDELGNLLSASVYTGPKTQSIDYVVDGMGRRVARKVNGAFDKAWLYRDSLRPVSEVDAAGTLTHFVYADAQSGAPDFLIRSGVMLRVVKDHIGSVRAIVDAQTGTVLQSIEYDAFGVVLSDTNPGFQPFGFAGGLYDAATGLVRFGARDYDAATGRWTNKDPIGFAGGDTNVYAYVGNDPVNLVDPTGLAVLGIHTNVSGGGLPYQAGHAWLTYTDDTGVTITYGLWPDSHKEVRDNGPGSDIRVGMEANIAPAASRYYDLTSEQEERLVKNLTTTVHWRLTNTCASWASEVVSDVVGDDLDANDWFGFETPRELAKSIQRKERDYHTSIADPRQVINRRSSL